MITVDVDDEALAEWNSGSDRNGGPFPEDYSNWSAHDLLSRSIDYEIIDPGGCELSYLGQAPEPSS